jgi:hypothetical protein
MCHPIWLHSRKYGTVWYHPASSKLWYLTALSFVNFQENLTGTSRDSLRVWSQLVRLAVCLALGAFFASTGSSGAEDPASKSPLLASNRPSDRPTLHLDQGVGSSGAEGFVLARLYLDSSWASDRPMVSPLRPSDHPVLLSSLLFLCNSSDATRKWTVGSSDGT